MTDNLAVSHNSRIITTKDGKKYEKAGLAKTTAAVIAANTASRIVQAAAMHLGAIPFSHVTLDENNDIYKSAAEKTFKKTGLDKKGIKFINITPENFDDVLKEMDKKSGILEKIPFLNKSVTTQRNSLAAEAAMGINAMYAPELKKIFVNKDEASVLVFHEIGHALNFNKMGIGKVLSKIRGPFIGIAIAAGLISVFKRKKVEGEETKGKIDKITTFFKDNCAKLTFIGFIPMLLEEGLASIKGGKLAKDFIPKEQLRQLNKNNAAAWLSYLGLAIGSTVGVKLASFIRDKITKPKEIEQ